MSTESVLFSTGPVDLECVSEYENSKHAQIVAGIAMCTLSLLLAVIMTVVAHKVKLLVWENDKIIPLMLIMMSCSLYSLLIYFAIANIVDQLYFIEQECQTPPPKIFTIPNSYVRQLPAFFLGVGAILNLNKWIYFELRIRAYIKIGCGLHEIGNAPAQQPGSARSESSSEGGTASENGSHLFGSQMYNSGSD